VRKERYTGFWWEKPEGNRVFEDLGVDGIYTFYRHGMGGWDELIWLRIRTTKG
jgi:hypothetical protein